MELFEGRGIRKVLVAVVALMAIGSLADFQLSSAVVNQASPFAVFVAAFGEGIEVLVGWAGLGLMAAACSKEHMVRSIVGMIVSAAMCALLTLVQIAECTKFMPNGGIVGFLVLVALSMILGVACFRAADREDPDKLFRVALLLSVYPFIALLVVNIVKIPWGRPRYRSIVVTDGLEFQPWWVMGGGAKDTFTALGLPSEEFKSFPSGHTASATTILSLVAASSVVTFLKGHDRELAIAGLVTVAVVMVGRIVAGAHFLTDVTMGFAVSYLTLFALNALILVKGAKRD